MIDASFLPPYLTKWEETQPVFSDWPKTMKCFVGFLEIGMHKYEVDLLQVRIPYKDLEDKYFLTCPFLSTRPAAEAIKYIESKYNITDSRGQWKWLKETIGYQGGSKWGW